MHRFEAIEQSDSGHYEGRAQHNGAQDAVGERAMLLVNSEAEVSKQHQEDKEIVDGERALQHIAGEELERVFAGPG